MSALHLFPMVTSHRSLNMDFLRGLVDIPLLLFEITGTPHHYRSPDFLHVRRRSRFLIPWKILLHFQTPPMFLMLSLHPLILLCLEVVLRIGSFTLLHQILNRYSSLPDLTSEEGSNRTKSSLAVLWGIAIQVSAAAEGLKKERKNNLS